MKKSILLLITFLFIISTSYSCKKKTCPAYNENQKEDYKIKNTKRKKAKLF